MEGIPREDLPQTLELLRKQLTEKDERNAALRKRMNQVGNEYLAEIDDLKATIKKTEVAWKAEEKRKLVLEKKIGELKTENKNLEKKLEEQLEENKRKEGMIDELKKEVAQMKEEESRRKEKESRDLVANFFCGLGRALFDETGEVKIGNLAQFGEVVRKAIPSSSEVNAQEAEAEEERPQMSRPTKKLRFSFEDQIRLIPPRETGSEFEDDIFDEYREAKSGSKDEDASREYDSGLGELPGHVQDEMGGENKEMGELDGEVGQGQDNAQDLEMENADGSDKDLKVILEKRAARRSKRLFHRRCSIPVVVKMEHL